MRRRGSGIFRLAIVVILLSGSIALAPSPAVAAQQTCDGTATARVANSGDVSEATGQWNSVAELPRPRSEFGAAVIDGAIYVAGGFGGLAMVDCYTTATGTWHTLPELPVGVHHPGVAALDGVLYVAGGHTEDGASTDALWAFDPSANAWEARAPMPTARGALGLATLDGRLYAVGGAAERWGGPATGAVEAYDPATDRWAELAAMPTVREHLAVTAGDGRIFAVGGRAHGSEDEGIATSTEVFDPERGTWETLTPMPTPRGGMCGVFTNGQVIVAGGERGTATHDEVEAFDLSSATWHTLPPMPTARHGVACAVIDDALYTIAGSTLGGRIENTGVVEVLDLSNEALASRQRAWVTRPSLSRHR